jgi:hypothetical protein
MCRLMNAGLAAVVAYGDPMPAKKRYSRVKFEDLPGETERPSAIFEFHYRSEGAGLVSCAMHLIGRRRVAQSTRLHVDHTVDHAAAAISELASGRRLSNSQECPR